MSVLHIPAVRLPVKRPTLHRVRSYDEASASEVMFIKDTITICNDEDFSTTFLLLMQR